MTYVIPEEKWTLSQHYIMRYTRQLMNRMRLKDWELRLLGEPSDEEAGELDTTPEPDEAYEDNGSGAIKLASMTAMPGDLVGGLHYDPILESYPPEELRHVLVHECLHLHFDRAQSSVNFDGQLHLNEKDFASFHFHFEQGLEHGINAVTRVLAPFLPLPPEPPQAKETQAAQAEPA